VKILIVLPDGRIHKLKLPFVNMSFREAPLTATTLAALVPSELKAEIKICDESVDTLPVNSNFDLVAISCLTGTCLRAYEIAKFYKSKGSTIVLGGVHVTLMPEEAALHADSIVIGFAELSFPQLLRDYASGSLKKRYFSETCINNFPIPRRDLQRKRAYAVQSTVFATRGCRSSCDFCSVYAANFGWHTRPVNQIVDEIRAIKDKRIAFNDVNLTDDVEYAKELLTAMIPLKKTWGGLASTLITKDDELLDLLQKSGCSFLLLGFESINSQSLNYMQKRFNKVSDYAELIEKLHKRNIIIQGCFIFGTDDDHLDVFQQTVDFVNEYKIDIPRYAIYTPYPQTKAFFKLQAENRIIHTNWFYYDTQHVVFQPKNMTPHELDEGFKLAWKKTFTVKSSFYRTISSGKNFPIAFVGNLAYKLYINRLWNDKNRFPKQFDALFTG